MRTAERGQQLFSALPSLDSIKLTANTSERRTQDRIDRNKRKLVRSPYGSFTPTNTLVRAQPTPASAAASVVGVEHGTPREGSSHATLLASAVALPDGERLKRRKSLFEEI